MSMRVKYSKIVLFMQRCVIMLWLQSHETLVQRVMMSQQSTNSSFLLRILINLYKPIIPPTLSYPIIDTISPVHSHVQFLYIIVLFTLSANSISAESLGQICFLDDDGVYLGSDIVIG